MKWDYDFEKTIDYSICPLCGTSFNEGERVSVLKSNKGPFIIVHKSCYEKMDQNQKDAGEVQDYEDDSLLDDDATIWRYMDLAKFIMMLKQSSLYFSSPSGFSDIYEGAHGELRNKEVWDNYYLSFAKTAIITAPDNCWHKIDRDSLLCDAKQLADDISKTGSTNVFINCWHLNESESEAMWKIYSKNIENAIAIKTTIGTLKKQLGANVIIRKINYIDYSKRFVGPNELFWFKRVSVRRKSPLRVK